MNKIIMVVFFVFASLLMIAIGYCVFQAVVDSFMWLLVLAGFLPSAFIAVLIGAEAFNARNIE